MAYIQGMDRKQVVLFPEFIDHYIEDDNPVRFMDAFVDILDLKKLEFKYSETKDTGRPPYNPGVEALYLWLHKSSSFQPQVRKRDV